MFSNSWPHLQIATESSPLLSAPSIVSMGCLKQTEVIVAEAWTEEHSFESEYRKYP